MFSGVGPNLRVFEMDRNLLLQGSGSELGIVAAPAPVHAAFTTGASCLHLRGTWSGSVIIMLADN